VAADVALFARYTSYLRAWQLLTYQVEELEEGSDAARSLVFEAHGQLALARSLRPFFRAWLAPWRSADGAIEEDVAYDRDAALANLRQNEPRLGELLRSATDVQAAVARTKSIGLVVVLILFVGSLCLLTLAQLARSHARLPSAVLGTTIALIAGWFTIIVLSVPE
jgi:hypothetical protein